MEANMALMAMVVFGVLFFCLASGIWVGFSLFIVGFVGMTLFSSLPAGNNMASSVWATIEKWEYVALPMFILMGEILYRSGISERLFRALVPWLYRLPGGLLLMNIISCTLFAAVSGSSAATTATVGRITLAELDKLGYDRRIAMGSLAGAGTLGFLIPPSLIMIVYAILAGVSIGKMFVAGILPGLLLSGVYSAYIIYRGIRNPEIAPRMQASYSWTERVTALKDLAPTLILILMVLGSIYAGVATPTEAAALGVFGATVFAFINRQMNPKILLECLMGAVKTNAMIMIIVVGAGFLSRVMGFLGIPAAITQAITELQLSPYVLMILLGIGLCGVGLSAGWILHRGDDPAYCPAHGDRRGFRSHLVRHLFDSDGGGQPDNAACGVQPVCYPGSHQRAHHAHRRLCAAVFLPDAADDGHHHGVSANRSLSAPTHDREVDVRYILFGQKKGKTYFR
jgi:C4-dicarboxylate transporter DctM subunit